VSRTVIIPALRLNGSQNAREHWRKRATRTKRERGLACVLCSAMDRPQRWPVVVTITRIGPRKLDGDNLAASAKAVRDGVADALGVDDGDESKVLWAYAQEKGPYAVRIEWTYCLVRVDPRHDCLECNPP